MTMKTDYQAITQAMICLEQLGLIDLSSKYNMNALSGLIYTMIDTHYDTQYIKECFLSNVDIKAT